MPTRLRIRAYAKVNLGLRVLGRRPDGYHELQTIMQTIGLHDELELEPREGRGGIELEQPRALPVPAEENLVYRAARLFCREHSLQAGLRISLKKGIPVGAGLGGGSSDAAATLAGLNRLFGLNLNVDELARLGAHLGSDVPFFIHGGTCLVEGRGEWVKRLPPLPRYTVVLILPPCRLSTAEVYRRFDVLQGKGDRTYTYTFVEHPRHLRNDLEPAALALAPELARYRDALAALQPEPRAWGLSGSGPAWFALFSTAEKAEAALDALRQELREAELILTGLTDRGYEFI